MVVGALDVAFARPYFLQSTMYFIASISIVVIMTTFLKIEINIPAFFAVPETHKDEEKSTPDKMLYDGTGKALGAFKYYRNNNNYPWR